MATKEKTAPAGSAPAEAIEAALGQRFHRALHSLWSVMHPIDREAVCCHDITLTQWGLLRALCEESAEVLTMGYLAGKLGLTPSGLTRCSDPLVERGLIKRGQKPGDRRACCLEPTARGFALWEEIQCECAEREGSLIEHLPEEESEQFVAALERLARAASSESSVED
jgi:DNA-binding MarR family transcriptional regulator